MEEHVLREFALGWISQLFAKYEKHMDFEIFHARGPLSLHIRRKFQGSNLTSIPNYDGVNVEPDLGGIIISPINRQKLWVIAKVKGNETDEKREFIRGLADATAHFDKGPYWYGNGKEGLWQVRITLLADSKPELAVQLCRLLQEDLDLPVLSINWIEGDMPAKKEYRGGRERHIILWVLNIRRYFPTPFFRNEWKEEFLEECWHEDQKTLLNIVGKQRVIAKSILSKCPRTRDQLEYSTACISYGCQRQKSRVVSTTRQARLDAQKG